MCICRCHPYAQAHHRPARDAILSAGRDHDSSGIGEIPRAWTVIQSFTPRLRVCFWEREREREREYECVCVCDVYKLHEYVKICITCVRDASSIRSLRVARICFHVCMWSIVLWICHVIGTPGCRAVWLWRSRHVTWTSDELCAPASCSPAAPPSSKAPHPDCPNNPNNVSKAPMTPTLIITNPSSWHHVSSRFYVGLIIQSHHILKTLYLGYGGVYMCVRIRRSIMSWIGGFGATEENSNLCATQEDEHHVGRRVYSGLPLRVTTIYYTYMYILLMLSFACTYHLLITVTLYASLLSGVAACTWPHR